MMRFLTLGARDTLIGWTPAAAGRDGPHRGTSLARRNLSGDD